MLSGGVIGQPKRPRRSHRKLVSVSSVWVEAGGNAVRRMSDDGLQGVRFLVLNTDVQALRSLKQVQTFAIGPIRQEERVPGVNPK